MPQLIGDDDDFRRPPRFVRKDRLPPECFDGRGWVVKRGVDYDIKTNSMQHWLYATADRIGMKCEIVKNHPKYGNDTLAFRFTKLPSEADSPRTGTEG